MKLQSFARCAGEGILAFVASASFFALTNAQRNPVWFLLLAALAFIGIRSLRSGWASLNAKQRALCVAFAVIFSATTLAGGKVVVGEAGHYSGGMEDVYILPFQPLDGLWTAALAVMALSLLMCARSLMGRYSRWLAQSGGQAAAGKGSFFLYWFLIFLCWSPYLFAYYPGLLYGDSAYCIEQALNGITNNNSPVFYNLLLRLFLTVGNAISSHEFGCFLYTLFQTLIISAAFSYTVVWLQRKGCRRFYCWLSLAFFALTPLMPMHAISMWKDPLYSIALLLLSLLTYDIAASQGELLLRKSIVFRLCAYTLAVCLIRNNGVLAMLPYWLCLFLIYRPLCKAQKKAARCFLAGLCTLLLFLGVYGPVYQLLGIYNPFVESISVPLQQMARVEAYEGNRTEEQHTFLSTLLAEPYQQAYTPCCADGVKWSTAFNTAFLNQNKPLLIKTWLEMGVANPRLYLEAYLLQTYELWSVADIQRNFVPTGATVLIPPERLASFGIQNNDQTAAINGFPLRELLPIDTPFITTGILVWSYLAVAVLTLLSCWRISKIAALLPLLFSWGTLLLGTPLVDWRRYVLFMIYALPLAFAMPGLCSRPSETEAPMMSAGLISDRQIPNHQS